MSILNDVYELPAASPPLSGDCLNHLISRKRKRDQDTVNSLPEGTFILNSHHSAPAEPKRTFSRLHVIQRAQLPLTYLDTSGTPNRLFRAYLGDFEEDAEPRDTRPSEHGVLIAQEECGGEKLLYAVEKVQQGVYALCQLGHWVTVDHVRCLARLPELSRGNAGSTTIQAPNGTPWWQTAALPNTALKTKAEPITEASPRLDICRPAAGLLQTKERPAITRTPSEITKSQALPDIDSDPDHLAFEVDGDIYLTLVTHYLKTLYLLKTPLSYFVKGPMSRIRGRFPKSTTTAGLQPLQPWELANALRTYLVSSSAADKKYRDKLPELLKDIPLRAGGNEEPAKKKKKRRKKLKVDKHGMLPDEEVYFVQWWHNDDTPSSSEHTAEQVLKRRSGYLRTRETFLQIILVLECMALESMQDDFEKSNNKSNDATEDADTAVSQDKALWKKARKSQDLKVHLELLLDKLCIWHSLGHEFEDEKGKAKPQTDPGKDSSNELRDFCVEVIVPFYMSRIPEQAAIVNKKLGGPSAPSKHKSKPRKPGEPEERIRTDKKPRRPWQRVSTETANQSSKAIPSLTRSATDSLVIPGLKRESSEIPLDQIPGKDSQPRASRRNTAFDLMKRREVDFSAMSVGMDAKTKKKAEVEEKLREAITALKKPNRVAAGHEFADVIEQRNLIAQGRARASQVQRSRATQGVQISATPKVGRRTKDMINATPHYKHQPALANDIPSFGTSMVPSSGMRPPPSSRFPSMDNVPQTGHRARHVQIEETPSRGPEKFDMPQIPESAIKAPDFSGKKGQAGVQTPSKPTRSVTFDLTPSKPVMGAAAVIAATPVKAMKTGLVTLGAGDAVGGVEERKKESIYDALGWDDDFDDIA